MISMDSIEKAFEQHGEIVRKTAESMAADIKKGASILEQAVKNGHCVFMCGNGGSAADAQHFAAEFVCKYKNDRRPFSAVALTVDTSALTAIGNDFGFENVFSRQIEALGRKEDVLIAITTSGISKNILNAIVKARKLGLTVIALTGARGKNMDADLVIAIPSEETARIQEMHELIYHSWCEYIESKII
ncbi:MAG: SIS domain-containing protein [Candidatus Paceibacterota bacterium]|jgi:D-sedoheptulose 7-phosphate isomerase